MIWLALALIMFVLSAGLMVLIGVALWLTLDPLTFALIITSLTLWAVIVVKFTR